MSKKECFNHWKNMKSVKIDLDSFCGQNMTVSKDEHQFKKIVSTNETYTECVQTTDESNMASNNEDKTVKPISVSKTFSQEYTEIETNTEVTESKNQIEVELRNHERKNQKPKNECHINLFGVFKHILKYSMLNSVFTLPNRVSAFDDITEVTQSCELLCNFNSSKYNGTEVNAEAYCENNYCENYAAKYALKYFEDNVDDYVHDNYDNYCKMNLDLIDVNSEKSTINPSLTDQQSLIQYDKAAFFSSRQMTDDVSFYDCKEFIINKHNNFTILQSKPNLWVIFLLVIS